MKVTGPCHCLEFAHLVSTFSGKAGKYAGGNPVCARPTPEWQKGIDLFLKKQPEKENIGNVDENRLVEKEPDAAEATRFESFCLYTSFV